MSRIKQSFTDEFKDQIVALYNSGKKPAEILKDYNISNSTLYKWIKEKTTSGSYKTKDNLTDQEKELIELRKENKRLMMENDILKQAALIMGRKSQ
jgi:transposase